MKCLKWSTLVLVSILLASCEPSGDDLFTRHFIIRKGEHYANPKWVEVLQSTRLTFQATFDSSAIYQFDDAGFQDSKNKLLGFSDCNSLHQDNSARFVWQWYNNQLEIHAYCYVDGERVEQFVGTVNIGQKGNYEIELTKDSYVFRLDHHRSVRIARGNVCDRGVYYMLWPYFGGSIPAPHDIRIDVKIQR